MPAGAFDMHEARPPEYPEVARHRIRRHLAPSGKLTGADGSRISGGEPLKCRHARLLRKRSKGLDKIVLTRLFGARRLNSRDPYHSQ
jgi:hypothetical protein